MEPRDEKKIFELEAVWKCDGGPKYSIRAKPAKISVMQRNRDELDCDDSETEEWVWEVNLSWKTAASRIPKTVEGLTFDKQYRGTLVATGPQRTVKTLWRIKASAYLRTNHGALGNLLLFLSFEERFWSYKRACVWWLEQYTPHHDPSVHG